VPPNGVGEDRRNGGVEHRIPVLEPDPIQHSKPRRGEGSSSVIEPDVSTRRTAASGLKKPTELLEDNRSKRTRQLLAKRGLVGGERVTEMEGHEHANPPSRQGSKEFRVPLEEGPEVHRDVLCGEIHEHVRLVFRLDADRQFVREVPRGLGIIGAKDERREVALRHLAVEREVGHFLPFRREPVRVPIGQDSIQDHEPFNGSRQRCRSSMTVVRLADGAIETLVVDVKQPPAGGAGRPGRRIAASE
jgi:hypothetical protein